MKAALGTVFIVNVFLVVADCNHGHGHDHHGHAHGDQDLNPAYKWSKAANTVQEDLTLDEEGIEHNNIEHGHAHVTESHEHNGQGYSHGDRGHVHGHSHGPPLKEPTVQEREKFREKSHETSDDDEEEEYRASKSTIWFNALMATLLISAAPFFILFLIPLDNSEEKRWLLKILLAFASGGLLGDAFLHLIPHALMVAQADESGHGHSHVHGHSHRGEEDHAPHDMSVGLGVLSGIVAFLCVEKFVRIMKGGHGHSHNVISHSITTDNPRDVKKANDALEKKKAKTTENNEQSSINEDVTEDNDDQTTENNEQSSIDEDVTEDNDDQNKTHKPKSKVEEKNKEQEIKVSGFLNLAADCFHNFTDGLAVGASFLAGDTIGIITTLTILFHEVPHEIGDFAILIQSGVPRGQAIALQALTAVGALTGCVVSLVLGGATEAAASLTLPFTAGGFIYIATVSVIPELLEGATFKQSVMEVVALLVGVLMMVIIALYE